MGLHSLLPQEHRRPGALPLSFEASARGDEKETIMKTETPILEYLLFFRDTQLAKRLSPEEMQTLTLEWVAWLNRLRK